MERKYYKSVIYTGIAGTTDKVITVPTGRKWRPITGRIRLQTDATVADRTIFLDIKDASGNVLYRSPENSTAITASQDKSLDYIFGIGSGYSANVSLRASEAAVVPLPEIILPEGFSIIIYVANGQAGDTYSIGFLIEEMSP